LDYPDPVDAPSQPLLERYTGKVSDLGKILIVVGALIVAVGLGLVLLGKTNLPLGRLPGDIYYRGKNTTFYFPLATSILLSVVLSVVLYVVSRFRR
jgi:H+/Cl- antiporter ClcA